MRAESCCSDTFLRLRGPETVPSIVDRSAEPADLPRHRIPRRRLLTLCGATSLGLLVGACARSAPTAPVTPTAPVPVAPTAPAAPPTAAPQTSAPAVQVTPRPTGRALKLLSWQAPTILNPYFSTGQADTTAARCCLEPLLTVDVAGRLEPALAAEVPARENGGLPDARTVVYRLRSGVTWAAGRPAVRVGAERGAQWPVAARLRRRDLECRRLDTV